MEESLTKSLEAIDNAFSKHLGESGPQLKNGAVVEIFFCRLVEKDIETGFEALFGSLQRSAIR